MSSPLLRAALAALAGVAVAAQAAAQTPPAQPYSGLQTREIKALSAEDVANLVAGRGMGLALPAELNFYPGPMHVLELAERIGLADQQRTAIERLLHSMKSEAIPLGHKLVAVEKDLDRQFAERTITPERLKAATAAIADIRGELRNAHLKYHLSTAALLSREQIRRYGELRGYADPAAPSGAPGSDGHGQMTGPKHTD